MILDFNVMRAFNPGGTILVELFFPDGNDFFDAVDGVLAGLKSGGAVPRRNGDDDRNIAYLHPPETMRDRDFLDRPLFLGFGGDFFQLLFRHLQVGLVLQIENLFPFEIVPDRADKRHNGATGVFQRFIDYRLRLDYIICYLNQVNLR